MADDLGFSDLGCYGSEIQTPHLDRLANEGVRFSQFYNCALCGPSRAALMTGLYPHQVGIERWTGLLNDRCVTAFELLKQAGYSTCAVGRLDMVTADDWHNPEKISRYVDRYLGSTGHTGPGNYFKAVRTTSFYRDGQPFTLPEAGSYKTDLITDFATDFIRSRAAKAEPFFLYVAEYAPHWPLQAKPEDIQKYRDLYRQLGWDEARRQRFRRLTESGLINSNTKLSPRDARADDWNKAEHRDWEIERMAVYAAQVDSLDQSVGRILAALQESKLSDDTLVIFLSDNGASDQGPAGSLDKPGETWRLDGTPTAVGNKPTNPPGGADTFVTAGPAWANVSNTPFRHHKATNYEGGISTPCLVRWPGKVTNVGTTIRTPAHITDILPTLLAAAGVQYPTHFSGRNVQALTSESLLSRFQGNDNAQERTLYWATSGCRAVRVGDWKLVSGSNKPWELYDLSVDRTELNDLVGQQPQRVQKMAAAFEAWLKN